MKSLINISIAIFIATLLPCMVAAQEAEIFRPFDTDRRTRQIGYRLPFASSIRTIDVEIVGGKAVLEGDIIVTEAALLDAPVIMAAGSRDRRWPAGVIPYVLNAAHPDFENIKAAVARANAETNLVLVERTSQPDYVEFVAGNGCSSWIGRKGGRQEIFIDGCQFGSIVHEILHAAGLYHEQARSDCDTHVTIHWENIRAGKENAFKTYIERNMSGADLGSYDYGSIMHYPRGAFGIGGKTTITPKNANAVVGQRDGLSKGDLNGLASLYPDNSRTGRPAVTDMVRPENVTASPTANPRLETSRRPWVIKP